jgi:DUF4097 and DUF4098 domain-containing protein YvlB
MTTSAPPGVHEFTTTGPIDVDVRVRSGDVIVTAVDRPVAVVSIHPQDGSEASRAAAEQTTVSYTDGRLQVETPRTTGWLGARRGRVRVSLRVPQESIMTANLGSADLRTEGRLGGASIDTGSGDVSIAEASGDVSAESGSGDLRLGRIGGNLRLHTGSGDVTAEDISGELSVESASGDVTIGAARGVARVHTASGDIRVEAARGGEVNIDAASGDVSVGVPTGTSVWLDLVSMSGSTRSELQPTDEPQGGPALTLRVQTMSGDIRVHRTAF